MTQLLEAPSSAAALEIPAPDAALRAQVWSVLKGLFPPPVIVERRRGQRYAFPRLIVITPMHADGVTPAAPAIVAAGKDLSEFGIGFFHPSPLPHRLVIVSAEAGGAESFGFLVDLHRCRFTKQGWYESAGRFLKAVTPPPRPES